MMKTEWIPPPFPPLRYLLDGGTMSQGLKGIQSLTESDSFNESEE